MLKRKSKRVLSIVLAVAMIVGLFPIAAFADGGHETSTVATSLPDAVNDVITLTEDVTLAAPFTVAQNEKVTINLNGHKITNASGQHTIVNSGNLTIIDSSTDKKGMVDNVSHQKAALYNNPGGIVVLNGGTFDRSQEAGSSPDSSGSNSYYTIRNYGTMTINEGVTVTQKGHFSSMITNGWYNISNPNDQSEPTEITNSPILTINGGTFTGGLNTIKNDDNGILVINGGNFGNVTQAVVQNHNIATITGGTFITTSEEGATNATYGIDNHGISAPNNYGTLTITGGSFSGATYAVWDRSASGSNVEVTITGGNFEASKAIGKDTSSYGTITITGGTFKDTESGDSAPSANEYIAEGNTLNENGQVVVDSSTAVASVNGVGYTSLQDAIDAAPAGGTVTLVRDFTLNAPTGLSDGEGAVLIEKNITIDGNNKTITAGTGFDVNKNDQGKISRGKYHVFNIQNAGNVVIKDLTIEGKSVAPDSVPRSGINIWSPGSATALTVENVTVNNCSTYGLTASGKDVDVVLNGLTTNGNAWGGVNIDTKNEGDVALTVNNADLNETSSIVFDKGTGATKDPVAKINGGSFENLVMNDGAQDTDLLINGGIFNPDADKPSGGTAVDIEKYLASGLVYNPYTGQVYKEPEYTGKYSYEIFTKVGDNGTISVDRYATEGDNVTITVSPDEAYMLDELTVTANGKEVEVKDNGDGTYTFKMPSADAKIVVTFAEDPDWEPAPEMPFTDVNEGDWFYDVVLYAYDNGLMTGVSATEFAPNQTTTRGMIVSMLARLEGVTSAEDAGFADVAANDWYATAVNWAASVGVVNGYEDNTFRPNAPITREQMAAILYNYADYKGYDVSARADLSDYADAASISSWAEDVLAWANAEGLINGMTATTIDPQGATTRAQTAAMFERFLTAHEA